VKEIRRLIEATPAQVFAVLSDGWLYTSWVVGASRIRDVDANWPDVGSQLHHSFGIWPLVIDDATKVLECDPGHRLVLQARGWPAGEATVTLRLSEDSPERCLVTMTEDVSRGPGRAVPRFLQRLAYLAERRQ
jgi:uncharacterized protein YndB with AHSA1/START domain